MNKLWSVVLSNLPMVFLTSSAKSRNHLFLVVTMIICLNLLISTSFKIIAIQELLFTTSSVFCALVACLFLFVLRNCTFEEQKQVLNLSLIALYLFSIGVYFLLNLPSSDSYVRDNVAYQIVFEDLPKKFFAATFSFGISFYLPHLLCVTQKQIIITSPHKRLLFALVGGFSFFTIDFLLLFGEPFAGRFIRIYFDSLIIFAGIMFTVGVLYLTYYLFGKRLNSRERSSSSHLDCSNYRYLVGLAVIVQLICLACEYRIVILQAGWSLAGCSVFFPLLMNFSNLIGELYGYKANMRLMLILVLSELTFNVLLTITIMLPAPEFFDLNPFYLFIKPNHLPASTLAILITFTSNAWLLEKLQRKGYAKIGVRIFLANVVSLILLCVVNYSLLFVGVFPYEQILNLAIGGWIYKFIAGIACLPFVIWLCRVFGEQPITIANSECSNHS